MLFPIAGVGHGVHCSHRGQNQTFSSSDKISSVHSSHLYSLNIKNGEIRKQNGRKERHTHKEIPWYIGWRGAEVTIMESAIINDNDSYFGTRCTTSNLIKSRVFLQTSLLDTTKHPQTCNVLFQKISIPPKEGNRISEGLWSSFSTSFPRSSIQDTEITYYKLTAALLSKLSVILLLTDVSKQIYCFHWWSLIYSHAAECFFKANMAYLIFSLRKQPTLILCQFWFLCKMMSEKWALKLDTIAQ